MASWLEYCRKNGLGQSVACIDDFNLIVKTCKVSELMDGICGWFYGKGKKILQQAAGKLRSQALARGPE
jgi:hypothetical protein